jgi:hypothetical protein
MVDLGSHVAQLRQPPLDGRLAQILMERGQQLGLPLTEQTLQAA